jgi:phospholipase D1/2
VFRGDLPPPEERLASTAERGPRRWTASRLIALSVWSLLLIAFWQGARQADVGAVDSLISAIEELATHPWAAAGILALYLIRPLLLVPITVVNLASGFVFGALGGWALALVGTLTSASVGYAIGRLLGSVGLGGEMLRRWPLLRTLRRRGFESVAAGGLMYLHADAVNMPAGLMRIRFRVFLAGIVVGNALTMTAAVLAGASVEGSLADATVALDATTLWLALALFAVSVAFAAWLRRRHALGEQSAAAADGAPSPPGR